MCPRRTSWRCTTQFTRPDPSGAPGALQRGTALNGLDYTIIALYFILVIGMGFVYRKRASQNLDAYFLGGKRIPWLWLAMSGSVSNFDITGTMWIVSMLFLMGMRSMWIHWMWGWMMGAFFLAFMGKWVRRSNVMTGAEWMLTRFGQGAGGQAARLAAALIAVVTMCGMIGYDFQGIGKFAYEFFPVFPPHTLALLIMGITTFYVLLGGLFSVVITDVIQTVFVTVAALLIAVVAYVQLSPDALRAALPPGWISLAPSWRIETYSGGGHGAYDMFGLLVVTWVVKGMLLNAGGPGGMYELQRFLAARDARDAAKIGAAWSGFMVVRWGMAMGITLLALAGLGLTDVADSETIMPRVLRDYIPAGAKGLVLAGLLAAFMSTFSSTVNSGASYLIRDFWQPFLRPRSDERHLVRASYAATILIVIAGVLIGYQARSIAQIWEWLMTALTACVVIPNVLRWYWWRMNGWGYAAGTLVGMAAAFVPPIIAPGAPMYVVFPFVTLYSLVASVAATLMTRPVDDATLKTFYTSVRPFGFWRHIRRECGLSAAQLGDPRESPWIALLNTLLGMLAITSCYLLPMFLVGHWHRQAAFCLAFAAGSLVALYFTWYRLLPKSGE